MQNFLKVPGYSWRRARKSVKSKRNKEEFELKQSQIGGLKTLEDNGYIDLYFGDESHFGLIPCVPYAWQKKGNQILFPSAKGKYLNVKGLISRKNDLFFEIHEATYNTDKCTSFIDRFVAQTNKKRVVILDNSPIHRSKKFMAKIEG